MNKEAVIKKLSEVTKLDYETCLKINDILEENFFILKKNKDKCVNALVDRLHVDSEKASFIYDSAKSIFNEGIKDKLHHPFKSQD